MCVSIRKVFLSAGIFWIWYYGLFTALAASSDGKKPDSKEDGLPIDIKLPIKHVLSRELQVYMNWFYAFPFNILIHDWFITKFLWLSLQLYFEKVTDITVNRPGSIIFKEVLISLATDSGLHPLVPYFIYFIADEVRKWLTFQYS